MAKPAVLTADACISPTKTLSPRGMLSIALVPISKTRKKNQSTQLDAKWYYARCRLLRAVDEPSRKTKNHGEEEPRLMRWKEAYKAPTGMVE